MPTPKLMFIIYTPSFEERSGGVIALHLLATRLASLGIDVRLWHDQRPRLAFPPSIAELRRFISYDVLHRSPFDRGQTPVSVACYGDVTDAIVVYPETVEGNPLNASRVVRWLLNTPGFFTGQARYGPDDLFFYYMQAFDDPQLNRFPDNELCLTSTHPAYVDYGRPDRTGNCHLMRKGARRDLMPPNGSIAVDELSHADTAAVFNRTDRFLCYDLYTRYNIYAALSGCLPIVVPEPDVSVEQWMPDPEDRYGVAYGEENIPWALATRDRLRERLARRAADENAMLHRFVTRCAKHFDFPPLIIGTGQTEVDAAPVLACKVAPAI